MNVTIEFHSCTVSTVFRWWIISIFDHKLMMIRTSLTSYDLCFQQTFQPSFLCFKFPCNSSFPYSSRSIFCSLQCLVFFFVLFVLSIFLWFMPVTPGLFLFHVIIRQFPALCYIFYPIEISSMCQISLNASHSAYFSTALDFGDFYTGILEW